jgi:hypothetical protein
LELKEDRSEGTEEEKKWLLMKLKDKQDSFLEVMVSRK